MPHLHTAQWDEVTFKASQFIIDYGLQSKQEKETEGRGKRKLKRQRERKGHLLIIQRWRASSPGITLSRTRESRSRGNDIATRHLCSYPRRAMRTNRQPSAQE
ncbi:hypothetical protein I7I50_03860 [Histoplasma capsulatum G186AR]|uniref:Uncharacterized protein n=1 Tax=Ajellomyces capsulatus TaxID=5037 RepID=A0A8H7YNT0_AJECA|nr:hypothetical protein I7I52_04768 [Histoplasma capsulatum]QSS74903.1 hypothetical protein I7I50_03860 [Histoplasma capsulatum G186AR]